VQNHWSTASILITAVQKINRTSSTDSFSYLTGTWIKTGRFFWNPRNCLRNNRRTPLKPRFLLDFPFNHHDKTQSCCLDPNAWQCFCSLNHVKFRGCCLNSHCCYGLELNSTFEPNVGKAIINHPQFYQLYGCCKPSFYMGGLWIIDVLTSIQTPSFAGKVWYNHH
jgi:hypothetical protein